jgi:hypothetical protein
MPHLENTEFVDLIDGTLPDARARHLDVCAGCRDHAEALRAVLARATDAGVPEPSPLFWDHFSARVRQEIDGIGTPQAAPRWIAWIRQPLVGWSACAALAVLVLAAAFWRAAAPAGPAVVSPPPLASIPRPAPDAPLDEPDDLEADEDWALVRTLADGLAWDDVHEAGLAARPGAADGAALRLSAEERAALVELLDDELKRTGA